MLSHTQKGWLQFPVFSSASKPHTDYLIFSKFVRTKIVRKKFVIEILMVAKLIKLPNEAEFQSCFPQITLLGLE